MKLELSSLESAINSYKKLLLRIRDNNFFESLDEVTKNGLKAGVIQHFDFTYELCWKFMKRYIEHNVEKDVDYLTRKELFRLAFGAGLIENIDNWFRYHIARNESSLIYRKDKAEDIFQISLQFIEDAERFLSELKKRND